MNAFTDVLIEFGAPSPAAPSRCPTHCRQEASDSGWRLRAESAPGGPALLVHIRNTVCSAWVCGEIYRYDQSTGDTRACATAFLADWEAGRARPERLAGRFLIAAWFPALRRWSVWTDRAGSLHAYHVEHPDRAAIGTYSPAVYARSARSLDWEGLAGFFSLGFFPGDRTFYTDVRILRPASRYDYDSDGRLLRSEAYWTWSHTPDESRSEADTIAEFGELFCRVVKEQTRTGRVALPLSGGLDSRTAAASLPPDSTVEAYAYGYSNDSIETKIAAQVAKAQGLPFTGHTVGPYLFDRLDDVVGAIEGFQDVTQARQAIVTVWLAERADYVLAAHWGDVFCDDMGLAGKDSASADVLEHTLSKMRKRGGEWLLDHVARPHLNGAAPEAVVRELLASELNRFADIGDPDFRVKALKTAQWAFRWTLASIRMYQFGAFPRLPFLDPLLIDFFCTVPTWMVAGRRLQIEYLKRFSPRQASVRWQVYDTDLFHYQHFNTWLLPRRAWRKAGRLLSGQRQIQRNWEVQFFAPGAWDRLEDCLLGGGRALPGLSSRAALAALMSRLRSQPGPADGYALSMALTFSAWLERA